MLQNTRSGVKCTITEEKQKQYVRQTNVPETFSDKATPATDFTDDLVVQYKYEVTVVRKTFVDDDDIQIVEINFDVNT